MRLSLFLSSALLLSACTPLQTQSEGEVYRLDLEEGLMCRHKDCYDISLILPSFHEQRIINAYQIDSERKSWTEEELIQLLIQPPGAEYAVQKVSGNEYLLPGNQYTSTVYGLLRDEFDLLYAGDGGKIVDITNSVKGIRLSPDENLNTDW